MLFRSGIAGYNLIFLKDNIPVFELARTGHIGDLFIKKEFRGLKISSKLNREAIIWFKKRGVKYSSLQVYPQNRHAYNIYKRWGYEDFHIEMRKKL